MVSTTSASISSLGVGSGLDLQGMITKLVAAEQTAKETPLDSKENNLLSQISAYGNLKSAISDFSSSLTPFSDAASLQERSVSLSNSSLFSATATSKATVGSYSLQVNKLATAQEIKSADFASSSTVVGTGTLTFQYGTYNGTTFTKNAAQPTESITIDSSDNTLAGIASKINSSNLNVTAEVINDGTGYCLALTDKNTGASNSIKISVADGSDSSNTDTNGLSQLSYDPTLSQGAGKNMTEVTAAQDAEMVYNGITVHRSSNTVTDLIPNVTINLTKADSTTPVQMTIGTNNRGLSSDINALVTAYNSKIEQTIGSLTAYNQSDTTKNGALLGDVTTQVIGDRIHQILTQNLNINSSVTSLAELGITTQKDGTLAVDSTKLSAALANNYDAAARIFSTAGECSDSQISCTKTSNNVQAGTYAVNITQVATQGQLVGGQAANLTIQKGVNDSLAISVDGVTSTVTLDAGTYSSADDLAQMVQSRINGVSAIKTADKSVAVTQNNGVLTITSNSYGSDSAVNVISSNAKADLVGDDTTTAPTATAGKDVAGTIGGVTAVGSGKELSGTGAFAGLALEVDGGATGDRGTIEYSQGITSQLTDYVNQVLSSTGLDSHVSTLQAQDKEVQKQKDDLTTYLSNYQQSLMTQFSALDVQIANLKSLSTEVTSLMTTISENTGAISGSKSN